MPGLLVAFVLGMFWRRSTPAAGFATILGGVVYSWLVEFAYNSLPPDPCRASRNISVRNSTSFTGWCW